MSSEPTSTLIDGSTLKGRSGVARVWHACGYSLAGVRAAYAGEAAIRQLVWLSL